MDDAEVAQLIERIYDLALEPSHWFELLGEVAGAFGGHAGSLEQEDLARARGGGLVLGLDPVAERLYFEHYAACNVLRRVENPGQRMAAFRPTTTIDAETVSRGDLARTEFYADFMRPMSIHSVLTFGLWHQGDNFAGIDIFRPPGAPAFEAADLAFAEHLHPHMVRAFRLGRRVASKLEMAAGLAAGLDQAPCGVIVLGADARLRHANAAAERLLGEPGGLHALGGVLVATDAADSERLRVLIARAASAGGATGGSVSIRRGEGKAPLQIAAAPFAAHRFSPFHDEAGVIVCITDPDADRAVPDAYLREVIGLTEAQARVARAVLAGDSVAGMAESLGVTTFTVKSHLGAIFAKTGASRQTEVAALLMRGAAPPGTVAE